MILRVCAGFGVFLIFWCRVWSVGSSERVGKEGTLSMGVLRMQ